MDKNFELFEQFAQYYDWHTPAVHYQHDHQFVIELIKEIKPDAKLLDIGCGTGFFMQKALAVGLDPIGLDPAKPMLDSAAKKVAKQRLIHAPMQALEAVDEFDAITALSWSINYCANDTELMAVLARCYKALKHSGIVILQTAHAANAAKVKRDFAVDTEQGPGGDSDIIFRYRFWSAKANQLNAEYQYQCVSTDESFSEVHHLNVADARLIGEVAKQVGFSHIRIVNDCSGAPLSDSISCFVIAYKP